uniref:NLGN4Y protein n=1 Tax=Fopius arisanus TaxID=64838 RepID=A0A0C9S0Z6_9HYME
MFRLEVLGVLLLSCTQILTEHREYYVPFNQYGHQRHSQNWDGGRMVKEVRVKQGRIRGYVVEPSANPQQLVDVFLGVPYAEPPVGLFRFSPPRSPQPWRDVRIAKEFAPVCPQVLPDLRLEVMPGRHEYLERLLPYLKNQSEDCLYLNIYAPHQSDGQSNPRRYPVMVFIHGESYEWNSGNFYDGTLLSSYGNIVFVTLNFRLGILGFLRPGTSDETTSNFGLMDHIAALVWLRENIAKFGGDPDSVTLMGHGTGATLVNLLLISPVATNQKKEEGGLFKRAILMSGSALSADAIGQAPLQITKQVAHALNCPVISDTDLAACLRNRDTDSLLNVKIHKPKYVPAFAPLIDNAVIPKKPLRLMENTQLFGRFDLMYGVTESEKFHILSPVAMLQGMSDSERDDVLREHARATYEVEQDLVLSKILDHYGNGDLDGYSENYRMINRDIVLDALSDSGTVAPLVMMAKLHAKANPKSYMYVFSHPRAMPSNSGDREEHTVHGDELPYILGVPLESEKYHPRGRYNIGESLLSEAMMTWWCNFAYTGNPNAPRRTRYMTDGPKAWRQYQVDWPEYNVESGRHLNLTIPPKVGRKYRSNEMEFWNTELPSVFRLKPHGPRPDILDRADGIGKYAIVSPYDSPNSYNMKYTTVVPNNLDRYGSTNDANDSRDKFPHSSAPGNSKQDKSSSDDESPLRGSSAITMVIGFGIVFLLINITAFFFLYHRRQGMKSKEAASKNSKRRLNGLDDGVKRAKPDKHQENPPELGRKCDSKPDISEVIKNDKAYDNSSNFGRRSKLSRQNSSSTIDTHIKVKEWIQQEIVHRCSPRFLRKTRETLQKEHNDKITRQQEIEDEQQRKLEEELLNKKPEPIYDESPLIVRPGCKKTKGPKVSVAIDATPATRTESILNQIPIELAKNLESFDDPYDNNYSDPQMTPQVVVIEHHHSRSDPLPMETVFKTIKPKFSTLSRTYESDSGSASSLYAKINPKLKCRLPRFNQPETAEEEISNDTCDGSEMQRPSDEDIYGRAPKMTTFGVPNEDVNVTCKEPTEREVISPEEALKTIKRRNYPKVLPDIEKRRSLPAPNFLYASKTSGTSLKDHRQGPHPSCASGYPPVPPPRIFGTTKSLDLPEEDEPVTTNLHVGPLLKRQDSIGKSQTDTSIIDSIERVAMTAQEVLSNHRDEYMEINLSPKCPVHGKTFIFPEVLSTSSASRSADNLDRTIGNPHWYVQPDNTTKGIANKSLPDVSIGNPNWYKTMRKQKEPNPFAQYGNPDDSPPHQAQLNEPKIVITPRRDIPGHNPPPPQLNLSPYPNIAAQSQELYLDNISRSNEECYGPQYFVEPFDGPLSPRDDSRDPTIVIAPSSSMKQPKIIIKPTTNVSRNRERNIPKVSAIPYPEVQHLPNNERDTKGVDVGKSSEKPPIKKKPKVTRIPSFSRRKEEQCTSDKTNPGIYPEKVEIVQRVNAAPGKVCIPVNNDNKSSIPTLTKGSVTVESSSCTGNSDSNTNTVKRKPVDKK